MLLNHLVRFFLSFLPSFSFSIDFAPRGGCSLIAQEIFYDDELPRLEIDQHQQQQQQRQQPMLIGCCCRRRRRLKKEKLVFSRSSNEELDQCKALMKSLI